MPTPAAWPAAERGHMHAPWSAQRRPPLCRLGPFPPSPQDVPLEETRQHVASMVEGLRGRQGSKYAALVAASGEG